MNLIITLLFFVFLLYYTDSGYHDLFDQFQKTYHRTYRNLAEQKQAMLNFKKNMKKVEALNQKADRNYDKTGIHSYHLSRYADQDPKQVLDHYGVTIKPFYYANNERDYLKKYEKNMENLPIENMKLYNLDQTEDIYDHFKKQFKKKNYTHDLANLIHYQRFYKTLIELNNKRFNGEEASIEEDADVVKKPHEYFFDKK